MIGIIVDEVFGSSQHYFMFKTLNELSATDDCYLFTNKVNSLPMNNKFAIMQQLEALHHPGILISTSLFSTQILANSLTASKKYFYIWQLDWMNMNGLLNKQLDRVLYNDEIELISRSNSHANVLSQICKKPCGVVYNWDKERLKTVIL